MAVQSGLPLTNKGKVNKHALLFPLIKAEINAGTDDWKKVLVIARSRLSGYTAAQRAGIEFTTKDLDKVKYDVRSGRRQGSSKRTTAPVPVKPVAAATGAVEQYTVAEIRSAAELLAACGRSVSKARKLLDLVSSVQQGE